MKINELNGQPKKLEKIQMSKHKEKRNGRNKKNRNYLKRI